ncbi:MAG: peptidoglycan DL-endopeptidase CwlO [Acidimicrobiaceae bacterium]|jgi:cell wall-associated NlpC family hydrolase|nr:peptidoglycan DL-endopeptidase CwlO [Acidimicrobiaceae bacterium]
MRVHKTPWLRRLGVLVGIASLTAGIVSAPAVPAAADKIADKQAEATKIAAQVEAQGEKVSILAERLNVARIKADEVQAAVERSKVEVARTDAQVAAARSELRGHVVAAYIKGGHFSEFQLLAGGDQHAGELAVRNSYVKSLTSSQRAAIDALAQAREAADAKHASLEAARKSAHDALAAVDADRRAASQAEAATEATLNRVKGELAGLVAAEEQRRAEAAARKAQAELAARQAREAAARAQPTQAGSAPTRGRVRSGPGAGTGVDPGPAPAPNPGAERAVAEAKRQIGKPYQYGAGGPDSFDCSGLTSWAWRAGGVSLPHSSSAQYSATHRVAISDVQPGDILFYGSPIHHVGIYVGNGSMVEASHSGTPVRYASIYRSDLVGAGRVG